jgi:hypothetical protein
MVTLSAVPAAPGELRPYESNNATSPSPQQAPPSLQQAPPAQDPVEPSIYNEFRDRIRALRSEEQKQWLARFSDDRSASFQRGEWDAVKHYDTLIRLIEENPRFKKEGSR